MHWNAESGYFGRKPVKRLARAHLYREHPFGGKRNTVQIFGRHNTTTCQLRYLTEFVEFAVGGSYLPWLGAIAL